MRATLGRPILSASPSHFEVSTFTLFLSYSLTLFHTLLRLTKVTAPAKSRVGAVSRSLLYFHFCAKLLPQVGRGQLRTAVPCNLPCIPAPPQFPSSFLIEIKAVRHRLKYAAGQGQGGQARAGNSWTGLDWDGQVCVDCSID